MSDFRIRAGFEEFVLTRNVPLHTELLFDTSCKILLFLSTKYPVSPLQPSMTLSFELLDPEYTDQIPDDLRIGLVRFIQTGEKEALLKRNKIRCTDSPLTPAQTDATSSEVEVKSATDMRRSEKVVGPVKNRPSDHPIDPSCATQSTYETPNVNEYRVWNDGDDDVVDAMRAQAVAENKSLCITYTNRNVAANSRAIESNESAEAAIGDVATLTSAAIPASAIAVDPPNFVNGASWWTPLNSSTTFRKRKWQTEAAIPITSEMTQSTDPSAMRFPAFVPTTTTLHAIARMPTAASPTTPMSLL